jgi:hypothetical protein
MSARTTITANADTKSGMTLRELANFAAWATTGGADPEQVVKVRVTMRGALRSVTITGGASAHWGEWAP